MIEHSQDGIRNKSEEPYILLNAAADDGQPQVLVLAELVADDNQLQIPVPFIVHEFILQDRERLNQPVKVLAAWAMLLVLLTAIKGISEDLLEAARVDGANELTIFFRIIIPSIMGTLVTVTTTTIIFTLKVFDIVMVMTGGQFGTEVIGVRFYKEMFTADNKGFGSAIAMVLLLAVIPVMIYNLREFSKREAF